MNEFGSWDEFVGTLNRAGFAWKDLLGQGREPLDIRRYGGILFPATQQPSANVNAFDDYEEGTFLPGLAFGGGTTGITYTTRSGHYTKIGRVVSMHIVIALSSKGSSTGSAVVTGAPFTTPVGGGISTAAVFWNSMTSSLINFTALFSSNSSNVILYGLTAGATSLATLADTDFANNSDIEFSITYQTST